LIIFFGFDRLLRLLVGREKTVSLYGPAGLLDQVHHKLLGYRWNLVDRYADDLVSCHRARACWPSAQSRFFG